ncbi:MAG TPA: alpha-amylase family glycosyl hydrolase [Anaeromyxobacteraceae bacterium]|nr:alpha-amylase family glycosyl hydrolase [Anaeromyxobacteraceae bacterium]
MARRRTAATLLGALLAASCAAPRPPAVSGAPPAPGASFWWNGAVFYEVFVRSFRDSDGDGNGDLEGLVAKLDYLNDGDPATDRDLGVDALWLMPVFASPSYHGYDVTDYEKVNPDYGTNQDLDRLVSEAHRRGIKVVVDLVLNHTSDQHPWFRESASSPQSPRRDWYVWSPTDPGWTQPWNTSASAWHPLKGAYYYGLFWRGMPDLNYRNPAVRAEAKRIAALWLSRGVDGFRLDAIRHLVETGPGAGQGGSPENHVFLRELAAAVRAAKPEAALVGEVWSSTDDIADYYGKGGDELQLLFDFPLADAIVKGVLGGSPDGIAAVLGEVLRTYPAGAVDGPFLRNHDQTRVATELGNDPAKLRLAAAILLTLPGSPFLWQGEEIGMQNGPGREDEWKRTPMAWDGSEKGGFSTGEPWMPFAPGKESANVAAETGDPASLLSRYRSLIRARHASPALSRGDLALLPARAPLLAFLRRGGGETVLVAHNLGAAPAEATGLSAPGAAAEPLLADPGATLASDGSGWRVALPPRGSGAWRLR